MCHRERCWVGWIPSFAVPPGTELWLAVMTVTTCASRIYIDCYCRWLDRWCYIYRLYFQLNQIPFGRWLQCGLVFPKCGTRSSGNNELSIPTWPTSAGGKFRLMGIRLSQTKLECSTEIFISIKILICKMLEEEVKFVYDI